MIQNRSLSNNPDEGIDSTCHFFRPDGRRSYQDEAWHIEEPWGQMFDYEAAHTLEGVPGLEGGKEPGRTTTSCTVAESKLDMLGCFAMSFCFQGHNKETHLPCIMIGMAGRPRRCTCSSHNMMRR